MEAFRKFIKVVHICRLRMVNRETRFGNATFKAFLSVFCRRQDSTSAEHIVVAPKGRVVIETFSPCADTEDDGRCNCC